MTLYPLLFVIALLTLSGVCASKLSSKFNFPVLLVFLFVGILAGSDGLGGLHFNDAAAANIVGTIALAFILFSGGYDTRWRAVKSVIGYGSILSSAGVLLTAATVGIFCHYGLGFELKWSFLLGAIISSTDAAAVFSILRSRSVSLKGRLKPLLEYESGSNDPMAAFLTIFMVGYVLEPTGSPWMILPMFAIKMGIGIAFGFLCAKTAVWIFNRIDLEYDGLYYVLGLGVALLAFGGCEVVQGNGFMSVYVCGMVLGNSRFIYQHGLGRFHEGLGWLMQVILFVMLGLLSFPHMVPAIAGQAMLIALFLMFAARPFAVFLCLIGSHFSYRERLFVSWVGLRGGAPIVLATFPLMAGIPESWKMFHIVFFIVLTSVLLQGKTLMRLARFLKLDRPLKQRPRIPISVENTGNSDNELCEFEVDEEAPFIGRRLADSELPKGALVLLIRRHNAFVVPNGDTEIRVRDTLMIFAEPEIIRQTSTLPGLRREEEL